MRGRVGELGRPAATWTGIAGALLLLQFLSNRVLRDPDPFGEGRGARWYLDGWSQFDGPRYLGIAEFGYSYTPGQRSNVVWFPLYPILTRGVEWLVGDYLVAGVVVSFVGGLAAAILYWIWLGNGGLTRAARWMAFAVLLAYPYGWYQYGVVHADSVFLACALAAFVLIGCDRPVLAGVAGVLATAARPTGLALLVALFVAALERDRVLTVAPDARGLVERFALPTRFDRSRLRLGHAGPLLAATGVGTYCLYLAVRWHDPFLFVTNERLYHPEDLPLLKRPFFVRWRDFTDPTYTLSITAQALIALAVVLSVPAVARRFGWGAGLYVAALVAIPTFSTGDFMGTGRYLLAAFPSMALLGEWMSTRRVGRPLVIASGLLMVLMSMAFARSWYLA